MSKSPLITRLAPLARFAQGAPAAGVTVVPPAPLTATDMQTILDQLLVLIAATGDPIEVDDEGTPLTTALASLDFVGSGVTATTVGDDVTVTIDPSSYGFVGEILISDTPSTPLVFADLLQNEAQNDLVYADA